MLLQEAVEFVDRLKDFSSASEVNSALQRILGLWGIDHFSFVSFPRPGQGLDDIVYTQIVPQVWLDRYAEENYLHIDPGIAFTKRTFHPFKFIDAPDPQRLGRQMIGDLHDLGMENAVMFPVVGAAGTKGIVWIQGEHMNLTAYPFLHTVLLYTFERLIVLDSEPEFSLMTGREMEVLKWSAAGKSAWETGEILKIAQRTVEDHVASAIRKLNAGNRTHAVAIAMRDGIIAL